MKIYGTFFLGLMVSLTSFAETPTEAVLRLAISKNIEQSRAWQKLIHIERNAIGIKSSQVTDRTFFLSNQDPYKKLNELEATLQSFAESSEKHARMIDNPLRKDTLKILDHSTHAICRFPARLKYLKSALSEAQAYWNSLPTLNCTFEKIYMDAVSPKSISFVFSSYYANNPGSAFGHTFFRINRQDENTPATRQELLDYGVGYAANVTVDNAAMYALLGLVGGFSGTWMNLPYYYKVREYNDFEARDLWSYDLNLTLDEVEMLALHLWEVGAHSYTYYFFTQNCAYHMLTALEAAAPRLHLIEHVPFYYVIPSDSMKALFFEKDLVKKVSFRPSTRKVFLERVNKLDDQTLQEFKTYIQTNTFPEGFTNLQDKDQALFLDAAIDLLDLQHPQIDREKNPELFKTKDDLLNQRARVNYISPSAKVAIETQERPDQAHGSSRVGLTYQEKNEIKYGFLNYRFALHDLQDPQYGMPHHAQLEFFNLNFQLLPEELKFDSMNLMKVFNIAPSNFFEDKSTWGFELGIQNKHAYCSPEDRDCFLNGFLAKYGKAVQFFDERLLAWGVMTVNGRYGAKLVDSKYYLAPGYELGVLGWLTEDLSLLATFGREYALNDRPYDQNYTIELRQGFKSKASLGLKVQNDFYGASLYYYY